MKFIIDSKVDFENRHGSPITDRAKSILDGLPLGELLTTPTIAARLGVKLSYVLKGGMMTGLDKYRYRDGARYLYGSQKTIKALIKHNGK